MGGEDATIELFGKTAPIEREVTRGQQTEMEYAIRQDESNWPMVKADRELVLSQDPKKWNDEIPSARMAICRFGHSKAKR